MGNVNQTPQLSNLGKLLIDSLQKIDQFEDATATKRENNTIHIPTVGSKLSSAYEQLRNASEYTEDNLLRTRAIRRYYKRTLSFHDRIATDTLAEELVTELTQSGYLPNDHTTEQEVKHLSSYIKQYYGAYWQYRKIEHNSDARTTFANWILDTLSVRSEQLFHSNIRQLYFTQLAFAYYSKSIDLHSLIRDEPISDEDLPLLLYIAIQKAILKLDHATIRTALLDSYRQNINRIHNFEAFNTRLDALFDSKTVQYMTRIVSRNGAAMRIIYSGFYSEDSSLTPDNLKTEDTLDYHVRQHIEREYESLDHRLDSGIGKSVVFLLITKGIIGLAVEVPYDLAIYDQIILVPLLLNLLFPALFIAASRLTLHTPGRRNTDSIVKQISHMVYQSNDEASFTIKRPRTVRSTGFNMVYGIMFLCSFAGLSYILYQLNFNLVQGVIFFIFLSTASFLAFRLANQIRELETVHTVQGGLVLIRDIIYLPFIYVGQYISDRYAKINIVATILDMLIELPLKTILRLVRQWTLFLNSKKDELV